MAVTMLTILFTPSEWPRLIFYVLFENAMCLYKAGATISGLFNYGLAKKWKVTPKYARMILKSDNRLTKIYDKNNNNSVSIEKRKGAILITDFANVLYKKKYVNINPSTTLNQPYFYLKAFFSGSLLKLLKSLSYNLQKKHRSCSLKEKKHKNVILHKRNFAMSIFLIVCAYFAFSLEQYGVGAYTFVNGIMYMVFAFGFLGRKH